MSMSPRRSWRSMRGRIAEELAAAPAGDKAPPGCATMCYMDAGKMKTQRVGVRELRQNLSRYLERVTAGERFEVTERNLPVAILAPLPGRASALERMITDGRVPPARPDPAGRGPPPGAPDPTAPGALLAPLPGRASALERMSTGGRVLPARLDLTELGPPPERPGEMTLSEALAEQRGE